MFLGQETTNLMTRPFPKLLQDLQWALNTEAPKTKIFSQDQALITSIRTASLELKLVHPIDKILN